jgi:aerobic-type carbon monoxide dehydrogenase small subunit (CoxS/CutS family)
MSEEGKKNKQDSKNLSKNSISRREFLKDAGLVVGGATMGSMALINACGGATETVTAPGATKTVTSTMPGGTVTTSVGAGATVTVTSPPVTQVVEVSPPGTITLKVNGDSYDCIVKPEWTLAYVLREKLGLTGTKRGCDNGDCGVCTVIMDGRPVLSCIVLALEAVGKTILTVEGLARNTEGLSPLQQSFADNNAAQCGFCVPGQLMTAKALLDFNPKPTLSEIKEFMAGTLCRCGVQNRVLHAIQALAK